MTALYDQELMTPAKLESALRAIGAERYHHRHPFHQLMHEGKLTHPQLQAWALNRYYYQSIIPIKDAIILSRAEDPAFRRAWRKRIIDHDGRRPGEGGIERQARVTKRQRRVRAAGEALGRAEQPTAQPFLLRSPPVPRGHPLKLDDLHRAMIA